MSAQEQSSVVAELVKALEKLHSVQLVTRGLRKSWARHFVRKVTRF